MPRSRRSRAAPSNYSRTTGSSSFIRSPAIGDESLNWNEAVNIRAGGHFLNSAHTLKYCRDQLSPNAFLRQDRGGYEAAGRRTAFDQAREIARLVADADRQILAAAAAHKGAAPVV